MFGKKVVVKFKDGKILKGWTANISPNKEVFYLYKHKELREKDKKDIVEVKLSSLRAVFFVKSHKGNEDYKKVRTFKGQPKVTPSLKMVDKKLQFDGYERDYSHNLGLSEQAIKELKRSMGASLVLMIRRDEKFDLDEVLVFFNKLFEKR